MTSLSKAPLIEAIFEVRWGEVQQLATPAGQSINFKFSPNEMEFFPGEFRAIATKKGFNHVERTNTHITQPLPHVVTNRFRPDANVWPCYQTGLGVMTVNQANDGYTWKSYKAACLDGIEMLNSAHENKLEQIPTIGVELKYQDGFIFEDGESALSFLKKAFRIGINNIPDILSSEHISDETKNHVVSFSSEITKPTGELILELQEGQINSKPGFILNTTIRSADSNKPTLTREAIDEWLENAHEIQKHTFSKVIDPAYRRTFK